MIWKNNSIIIIITIDKKKGRNIGITQTNKHISTIIAVEKEIHPFY